MHIAAVLAVTLLNIHESARFKTGAFRFWGCLPVPESSAAEQKMQECLKVRLALEPLTCIRLALAWVNHLPTFQHSMFLSPGIRPPSSEAPPSSHSDTALIFLHTAARPPPPHHGCCVRLSEYIHVVLSIGTAADHVSHCWQCNTLLIFVD